MRISGHSPFVAQALGTLSLAPCCQAPQRCLHTDVEDRTRVAELVGHHRNVVETVKVRKRLGVILVLDERLRPTVQEADMGVGAEDFLAVEFEHEAGHAVRSWVLRTKVEREVAHGFFPISRAIWGSCQHLFDSTGLFGPQSEFGGTLWWLGPRNRL